MRRLGVFVFYDPQGIVDDYVLYLLREMCSVCTEMITVCNGKLTDEGKSRLLRYSGSVFCRENRGMDAGALKDFFTNLGVREYWSSFDELVWFNDTCYGPLVPMAEVFREMERREPCDFWGITAHARSNAKWPGSKNTGIGEHLQSYFIVVKQPLIADERFFRFWQDIPVSDNFNATVANYELSLTGTFASWGYRYGVFCDTRSRDTNPNCVCNLMAEAMYLLVSQYNCPFVKRKNFIRTRSETLVQTNGEQVSKTVQYIRRHKAYDISLIYQNLIRLYDQSLWRENLCHDFVLSAEHSPNGPVPSSLILAELDHEDAVWELADCLNAVPENCMLRVVTRRSELTEAIQKQLPGCAVSVLPDRHTGLASLFAILDEEEIDRYPYFCFLQENWGEPGNGLHLPESSIRFSLYGNLVSGKNFIRNVLHTFVAEPLLGILEPPIFPQSYIGGYGRQKTRSEYASDYGVVLSDRYGETPIVCQSSCWCRREVVSAVRAQLENRLAGMEDGALECLIGDIALSSGFYCAEVAETRQAACLLENQRWIVDSAQNQKLFTVKKQLQIVAAINSGRIEPRNASVSTFELLKLLGMMLCYHVEKIINPHIPQEKKDTFFLGTRDVFNVYRRIAAVKHRS